MRKLGYALGIVLLWSVSACHKDHGYTDYYEPYSYSDDYGYSDGDRRDHHGHGDDDDGSRNDDDGTDDTNDICYYGYDGCYYPYPYPYNDYEYVQGYALSYSDDYTYASVTGIIGQVTDPSSIPNLGTAEYDGDSRISVILADDGGAYTLIGDSTINVDFGNALVDVRLDSFDVLDTDKAFAQIGWVNIEDMVIAGAGFSGGTITYDNTQDARAFSGDPEDNSYGHFYGTRTVPDEVAGVFNISGADGSINGGFIATDKIN